jgi:ABC-type dipeptide/oligopeptide/nickel transport system permease subunit
MNLDPRALKRFRGNRAAVGSLAVLFLLVFAALFAPWLAPHSPLEVDSEALKLVPLESSLHWLGTDDVGRDQLSRLVFGARLSLGIGFLAVIISLLVGLPFGLIAGFYGGRLDQLIMRLTDIFMSIPNILFAIVVVAITGPSLSNTVIAVSVVAIPQLVRVVRGVAMAEREKLYVQAARGYGLRRSRILLRHILPNCMAPIIVQATLGFSDAILNAAALGFLGLGAQPPTPEWGAMLADARPYIDSAWWLVTLPGACILVTSLCFNLLGDGLRDALDPKVQS